MDPLLLDSPCKIRRRSYGFQVANVLRYGTVSVNNPDNFQCKLCNSVFYVQTLFSFLLMKLLFTCLTIMTEHGKNYFFLSLL